MARKSDKRERLLKAARSLIHRQGFHRTTLADISERSGVSLGNLYYYFKTKEEILSAVVGDRTARFLALAGAWDGEPDPRERLMKFLEMPVVIHKSIAERGCPVGSLSQELCKEGETATDLASETLKAQIDWVSAQFLALGEEEAAPLGHQFIATLQGASLLAHAMNRSEVLLDQVERLKDWVRGL